MSFVKMQRTQSLTRPTTHAAITTISTSHNSISSQYSQPSTSLAAPKANPISHAANKNLFTKTHFDLCHLTSSSLSYFYYSQPSEGNNSSARKQLNINTHTLQLSLATNKPTSPAKIILQKLLAKISSTTKKSFRLLPKRLFTRGHETSSRDPRYRLKGKGLRLSFINATRCRQNLKKIHSADLMKTKTHTYGPSFIYIHTYPHM